MRDEKMIEELKREISQCEYWLRIEGSCAHSYDYAHLASLQEKLSKAERGEPV